MVLRFCVLYVKQQRSSAADLKGVTVQSRNVPMSVCIHLFFLSTFGFLSWFPAQQAAVDIPEKSSSPETAVQELDARLWRTEFVRAEQLNSGHSETASRMKSTVPDFPSALEPIPTTGVLRDLSDGSAFTHSFETDAQRSISDWDKAAAFPAHKGGSAAAASGPSLTTYLVAFVAAVVLLGTILSPK